MWWYYGRCLWKNIKSKILALDIHWFRFYDHLKFEIRRKIAISKKWKMVCCGCNFLWNSMKFWLKMHFLDTFRLLQRKNSKIKNCTLGNIFFIFYYVTRNHLLATGLKNWKWFLCHLKAKRCTCLIKQLIFW